MGKESFHYPDTAKLFDLLEETTRRSGVSRGQAFEDFLMMSVAALSGGRMEELYLQSVAKHTAGKQGKRGCDSIARMFGELVAAMEQDTHEQMRDIVGDLFEGAISYGEHGQFLTPMPVCELMARLTLDEQAHDPVDAPSIDTAGVPDARDQTLEDAASQDLPPKRIHDPCCGSGRMLLAAAHINRHWEFVGQDVDLRCVRMTALNLAFRNLYGYVIWGNSLAVEKKLVYRTGFDGCGVLREIPLAACPAPIQQIVRDSGAILETSPQIQSSSEGNEIESPRSQTQLRLF